MTNSPWDIMDTHPLIDDNDTIIPDWLCPSRRSVYRLQSMASDANRKAFILALSGKNEQAIRQWCFRQLLNDAASHAKGCREANGKRGEFLD